MLKEACRADVPLLLFSFVDLGRLVQKTFHLTTTTAVDQLSCAWVMPGSALRKKHGQRGKKAGKGNQRLSNAMNSNLYET